MKQIAQHCAFNAFEGSGYLSGQFEELLKSATKRPEGLREKHSLLSK